MMMLSCGSKEAKETESVEADVADVEAAQMQGREAARKFVGREFRDTMELHGALLEVAAMRSRYTRANAVDARAAFDSTFISTVRTVRPGVAEQIERSRR